MQIEFTSEFQGDLKKLNKRNGRLVDRIHKQLGIFSQNPKHPSLRLHKLKGNLGTSWSISVASNFRVLFVWEGDSAIFYDLGTHSEVYQD